MSKFIVEIETSSNAFQEDNLQSELMRILDKINSSIYEGSYDGKVRDINGNTVGSFKLETDNED